MVSVDLLVVATVGISRLARIGNVYESALVFSNDPSLRLEVTVPYGGIDISSELKSDIILSLKVSLSKIK